MFSRILVRFPNWLGDVVMALPALAAVRARWKDAYLAVAGPAAFEPLLSILPGVDGTVSLVACGWRDRNGWNRDTTAVAAGGFNLAILLTNSFASARLIAGSGIPERWGYATDWRARFLTRAVPRTIRPAGRERHQSRYYLRLIEALGCEAPDGPFAIDIPSAWRERAEATLAASGAAKKRVGFAPGAAYGWAKRWPPEYVARVVDRVMNTGDVTCVLVGAPADAEAGEALLGALPPHRAAGVVNLIGRTDLPQLAGVISHCAAFVSNDSGAMHLASALGRPVVAVFGATDETATAPLGDHTLVTGTAWCRPCLRRECPIDHRCMRSIAPERVFQAMAGRW